MRLLLVEDDRMIGEALRRALADAGHVADWVTDGEQAIDALGDADYDAMLLDLGLGRIDGTVVLRTARQRDMALPVIVVTARDEVDRKVDVLDLGADDYLIKPFDVKELLARVRAVTRRGTSPSTPLIVAGELTLDPASKEASFREARCRLSAREFALLEALARRPGVIRARVDLEERIYGWNQAVESNTVEVLVHGLRRKLGAEVIRTVRGAGYMIDRQR
jgi:two-component system OmpR family response regulator